MCYVISSVACAVLTVWRGNIMARQQMANGAIEQHRRHRQ